MSNAMAISFPDLITTITVYTLSSDIAAMQILPFGENGTRLGPVSWLPQGARIQACGEGFDENTIKVAYEGQYYFVFLDDIETQRKSTAAASN